MTPKKGDLLISEPFLNDGNFERSVILLCEHNEEGSFGFVLNKLTEYQLADVINDEIDFKLYLGGPVDHSSMHFIHVKPDLISEGVHLKDNLYWGGNFEEIKAKIGLGELSSNEIRFFLGYSGWDSGQLADEIENETWIVYSGPIDFILDMNPESLWRDILKRIGGRYKAIAHFPTDPRLN